MSVDKLYRFFIVFNIMIGAVACTYGYMNDRPAPFFVIPVTNLVVGLLLLVQRWKV